MPERKGMMETRKLQEVLISALASRIRYGLKEKGWTASPLRYQNMKKFKEVCHKFKTFLSS